MTIRSRKSELLAENPGSTITEPRGSNHFHKFVLLCVP